MRKITLEQKKKAVEIALSGGNPLPYLKECGSKKPDALWYTIKQNLKVTDPEAFAKLPERVGARQNVAEPDCTLVICDGETVLPLESEITDDEPSHFFSEDALQDAKDEDDLEITAVRNKVLGRFQFDEEHEVMIWNSPYGDEVMMDAEHWWKMADLLPKVLQKLKIDKNGDENPKI